ncbi:MAG TPA: efflux RND transporter periplasmic adaptor subunit [Opitutaceae bacterium]
MNVSRRLLGPIEAIALGSTLLFSACAKKDAAKNDEPKIPTVNFVVAAIKTAPTDLRLPAALQAFQDTPIYARTTGYIQKWFFDIGDHVKAGDTLALIDGPDLDQQLNQAKANLGQTQANLALAQVSADRWKSLGSQHAVAQQDVDTKVADYQARLADVKAAQANVDRLSQLKAYQNVTAPYDGVVSSRNAQIGALITAGNSNEIYHIAQTDMLRVYVNVPQSYIRAITPGLVVQILVPEFPKTPFTGKVARFAGALDPVSRTLLVEIQIPNAEAKLFPGMFCEVLFKVLPPDPAIIIPSNAILVRADGTLVATVDDSNRIHLAHVQLGRDFGTQVEVLNGLAAGLRVVSNPTDALADGLEVEPHDQKAEQADQQKRDQEKQQQGQKDGNNEKDQRKDEKS